MRIPFPMQWWDSHSKWLSSAVQNIHNAAYDNFEQTRISLGTASVRTFDIWIWLWYWWWASYVILMRNVHTCKEASLRLRAVLLCLLDENLHTSPKLIWQMLQIQSPKRIRKLINVSGKMLAIQTYTYVCTYICTLLSKLIPLLVNELECELMWVIPVRNVYCKPICYSTLHEPLWSQIVGDGKLSSFGSGLYIVNVNMKAVIGWAKATSVNLIRT